MSEHQYKYMTPVKTEDTVFEVYLPGMLHKPFARIDLIDSEYRLTIVHHQELTFSTSLLEEITNFMRVMEESWAETHAWNA